MEAQQIPSDEIDAFNLSAVDQAGTVFRWRDGFYRALKSEAAPFYASLFQKGTIQRLVDRGLLVESELAPLALAGFECVIRHRRIPFVSFPYEWCAPMIRDAANAVLDLLTDLATDGLTLKDGHLFNSLFDGCQPTHVDLTSIVPAEPDGHWPGAAEFRTRCIHPLVLMEQGDDRVARMLMFEELAVTRTDVHRWHRAGTGANSVRRLATDFAGALWQQLRQSLPHQFGRRPDHSGTVEELRAELRASGETPTDHGSPAPAGSSDEARDYPQRATRELLERLRPRTVLDIGCNSGIYSHLAARSGAIVVSFDKNPTRVAELYRNARREGLRVLPLVMDFCRPTPSLGPLNYWSSGATERLRCEMVLAMDLLPSLIEQRGMHFREIAAGLAAFSTRWTVAGFPNPVQPAQDRSGDLVESLKREFRSVEAVPGGTAHDLLLFLCEK